MNFYEELNKYQSDPRMRLVNRVATQCGMWFSDEDKLMIMFYLNQRITFLGLVDYFKETGKFNVPTGNYPGQPTTNDMYTAPWLQMLRSYVPE